MSEEEKCRSGTERKGNLQFLGGEKNKEERKIDRKKNVSALDKIKKVCQIQTLFKKEKNNEEKT